MLTVFTALTALTVLTSPAVAQDEAPTKVVKVPDLPLEVTLPDPETGPPPWVNIAQVENDMLLSVDHNEDNSTIWFGYTEGLQPDLSKAQPDGLTEGQLEVLSFLGFTPPAEVQASATEHATFGLTWVSLGTTTLDDPNLEEPVTYELHGVVIPAESGFVQVLGLSATPGAIAGHVETLLGWTTLKRPPVAADKLVTGKLEHPSGYTIDIPHGWRALTDDEISTFAPLRVGGDGPHGSVRSHAVFVDTADFSGRTHFTCSTLSYPEKPPEVVDEAKSPPHGNRYRTFTRLRLRGGKYKNAKGTELELPRIEDLTAATGIKVEADALGTLSVVDLGDREGYFWRTQGARADTPVELATFATAWDDLGLDCLIAEAPNDGNVENLDIFARTIMTVRVVDGANHPHQMGVRGQYRKLWPWTHPLLQVWIFAGILLLVGIVLAFRGD